MRKIILLFFLLVPAAGCKSNIKDYYKPFEGKVIITKIRDSMYNPSGNNMYSDIFMDFMPDDPVAPEQYRYKKWEDKGIRFSYKSRMNFYKPWIRKAGIKVGNSYRATRYEKFRGFGSSCPVVFKVYLDKPVK